jgi:hypothetical protein
MLSDFFISMGDYLDPITIHHVCITLLGFYFLVIIVITVKVLSRPDRRIQLSSTLPTTQPPRPLPRRMNTRQRSYLRAQQSLYLHDDVEDRAPTPFLRIEDASRSQWLDESHYGTFALNKTQNNPPVNKQPHPLLRFRTLKVFSPNFFTRYLEPSKPKLARHHSQQEARPDQSKAEYEIFANKIRGAAHRWYGKTLHARHGNPPKFLNPPKLNLCFREACLQDNPNRLFKACNHTIEAMFRYALESKSEEEFKGKFRAYQLMWHPDYWTAKGADKKTVEKASAIMSIINKLGEAREV